MISVDIVDDTHIQSGSVYITGHGIPGTTPGSGSPQALNVLGPQGSFVQAAVVISGATCSGTTATITTSVANSVAQGQTVFVSGVAPPGYNGVFTVTSVPSTTTFGYSVPAGLGNGTGGAVYLPVLISSPTMNGASGVGSIVTVTLTGTDNIPVNSPVFLSGLTGVGAGWNGVWSVSQNPSSNPALASNQFQIEIPAASGTATLPANPIVQIVSLKPIGVASLPTNPATNNPYLSLDQNIMGFSAQLVVMVTPANATPFPLGITLGNANLSNLGTPPFAPGQQAGNSVVDIVEFYYAGSGGNSTFDVSQVDGFALPLTLQASTVTSGYGQVGVNPIQLGLYRQKIGEAFNAFIRNEPPDVQGIGQFGRLIYDRAVNVSPRSIAPASQTGTKLQQVQLAPLSGGSAIVRATAAAAHGLVPGQPIHVTDAGAPYDGRFLVVATGLTDPSLRDTQFTYAALSAAGPTASGSVIPTESGVIAIGATDLVVEVTSGTTPSSGATVRLSGVPDGTFSSSIDTMYTVSPIPAGAGLSDRAVYLATTTDQSFVIGNATGGGTLATPVFVDPPGLPDGQFYVIAAPKDWLANQTVATAIDDPMTSWWDTTIDAFFAPGNYLQVAIGTSTSYTGVYDSAAQAFDFYPGQATSGTPSFRLPKPVPSGGQSQSLANATWVWGQANIPSDDQGTVWDQVVQAFCRGVAMDGVLTLAQLTPGASNTAWTNTANWYTEHGIATVPPYMSRYCPFSKFLHYGTLAGGTDRSGNRSIYLHNLAYGFSEDETPLGSNGAAITTGVPSKMDGTVPDTATMTLIVGRFPTDGRAQGMAVMEAGVVLEIVVTDPGSGYVSPPTISITPPTDGMQATAVATIAGGQVTGVTMTSQGSGYDFGPQVTFSPGQP